MVSVDLLTTLGGPWKDGTRPKDLYLRQVSRSPHRYVDDIVRGLSSKARRVQGGCAELASLLSADHPELLYPHVDLFLSNLAAKAPILRWEAVCTTGNLASVDVLHKLPPHLAELSSCLEHKSIVLQGHAVRALGKLAAAQGELAARILDALVAAEKHFPGNRVGFLVEAMPVFAKPDALRDKALRFAMKHASSDTKVVATKARKAIQALQRPA